MKNSGDNFEHFPTGKDRKKLIADNSKKIEAYKRNRGAGRFYGWVDSSIEEGTQGSFNYSFYKVLPRGVNNIREYIEHILEDKKSKAIGVEFGGPGDRLFKGFTPELFKKSVGVTLVDWHGDDRKPDPGSKHKVVEGDILTSHTYEELEKILEGDKVDLIMSRLAAGLEYIPIEPYAVSKILQVWYKLLNDGGVMFVQTPVFFNELLKEWATMIKDQYKDVLEFQEDAGGESDGSNTQGTHSSSAFRLRKLPGAPTELPLLDPRKVKNTPMGTGHW